MKPCLWFLNCRCASQSRIRTTEISFLEFLWLCSQNGSGGKGPHWILWSKCPAILQDVTQDCMQMVLEHLQWGRFQTFFKIFIKKLHFMMLNFILKLLLLELLYFSESYMTLCCSGQVSWLIHLPFTDTRKG